MAIDQGGAQLNIANGIREFALASPDMTAIIDGDRSITYRQLYERASRLANALLSADLKAGVAVGVLLGNRLEYSEVAAGCAMAGLPIVPINPRQTAQENSYILEHSEAQALIYDAQLFDSLPATLPKVVWAIDGDRWLYRCGDGQDRAEFLVGSDITRSIRRGWDGRVLCRDRQSSHFHDYHGVRNDR